MKEQTSKYTIQELKDMGRVVLEYNTGSHLYGTNIPGSDRDYKGVFILPETDYGAFDFVPEWEEIKEAKTIVNGVEVEGTYYNIRKFMQLLRKSNPNMLEIFDITDDCLVHKHPCMDILIENSATFITKACMESFSGYAMEQINKATGQNKKQNWEKSKVERKTVLDFCHVPHKQGSIPVKEWLASKIATYKDCSLSRIEHMTGTYGLYILPPNSKPKGIVSDEETSMSLSLSETPKNLMPDTIMQFNEAAWSKHCKDYKSYKTWQSERNEQRWIDVKAHGQKIDGKNMLHMQRLMNMAMDIAVGNGIITRRPEAADLVKIRKGEVPLQNLLDTAREKLNGIRKAFETTNLPDEVDINKCTEMLSEIKMGFYSEHNRNL